MDNMRGSLCDITQIIKCDLAKAKIDFFNFLQLFIISATFSHLFILGVDTLGMGRKNHHGHPMWVMTPYVFV